MLRILLYGLVSLFFFSPAAWGCSCVGSPTGQLSEILEKHVLVYGTPKKTEWLGTYEHVPLLSGDRRFNEGRTTLIDVHVIGLSTQPELTFIHPVLPGSCMMSPTLGYKHWYILAKDSFGSYSSDGCLYRSLPIGAILDYYHNGSDAYVSNSMHCPRYNQEEKIPRENWSESFDDESRCDFWQRDYNSVFQELQKVYIFKDLGVSRDKQAEP